MKSLIFSIILFFGFFQFSFAQTGNIDADLQKKIDEVINSAKDAGSIDQPVSDLTKKVIDSSAKSQLDKKKPEGYYSKDCQNWKVIEAAKNQGEYGMTKMYYKTLEGGFPSVFDIKKQTMFSIDQYKLFYIKILSDAITGIVNGVPVYREVDSAKMQNGIAGILQGVMLVAAEGSSSWLLTTGQDNSPRLLHMLVGEKNPALENYISVVCSKEAKCFLVNKDRKSMPLNFTSKEHIALREKGIFSNEKINVFFRMCEVIDAPSFNDDLASEIKGFEAVCGKKIDLLTAKKAKDKITSICKELKYQILPKVKTYR